MRQDHNERATIVSLSLSNTLWNHSPIGFGRRHTFSISLTLLQEGANEIYATSTFVSVDELAEEDDARNAGVSIMIRNPNFLGSFGWMVGESS